MTELELTHLRFLLEIREKATAAMHLYDERLEDFVLQLRDGGASARGMAEQLGMDGASPSTIQTWTKNARRRRNGG